MYVHTRYKVSRYDSYHRGVQQPEVMTCLTHSKQNSKVLHIYYYRPEKVQKWWRVRNAFQACTSIINKNYNKTAISQPFYQAILIKLNTVMRNITVQHGKRWRSFNCWAFQTGMALGTPRISRTWWEYAAWLLNPFVCDFGHTVSNRNITHIVIVY